MSFKALRDMLASQASRPPEAVEWPMPIDDLDVEERRRRNWHTGNRPIVPYSTLGMNPPTREEINQTLDNEVTRILQFPPAPFIASPPSSPSEVTPGAEGLVFYTAPGAATPIAVLHGPGGTGKTYRIRQYQEEHQEESVLLTATTGVAAINIGAGAVTVNSAFKYFDEESLRDMLKYRPHQVAREIGDYDLIVIDEMSMLAAPVLELLYGFLESLNRQRFEKDERRIKLLLSGDFCQLPPISRRKDGQRMTGLVPASVTVANGGESINM